MAKRVGDSSANNIFGNAENDFIFGNGGDDILRGAGGNDFILGGAGNDSIRGGEGIDILDGGRGNDIVNGGMGNDFVGGGKGSDQLFGGMGNDTFFFFSNAYSKSAPEAAVDTINDFASGESILLFKFDANSGTVVNGEVYATLGGVSVHVATIANYTNQVVNFEYSNGTMNDNGYFDPGVMG